MPKQKDEKHYDLIPRLEDYEELRESQPGQLAKLLVPLRDSVAFDVLVGCSCTVILAWKLEGYPLWLPFVGVAGVALAGIVARALRG